MSFTVDLAGQAAVVTRGITASGGLTQAARPLRRQVVVGDVRYLKKMKAVRRAIEQLPATCEAKPTCGG